MCERFGVTATIFQIAVRELVRITALGLAQMRAEIAY